MFECEDGLNFINPTDLEWMSLNYRKERAAKMSLSKRRMILMMFQTDCQYFPSMKEIRDELVLAQMNELEIEKVKWDDETKF